VTNFAPKDVIDPKTGKKKLVWDAKNGRIPYDYWDCEIYAAVAAQMVTGDLGWSAASWADHWIPKEAPVVSLAPRVPLLNER
jgi:hypothetical protein